MYGFLLTIQKCHLVSPTMRDGFNHTFNTYVVTGYDERHYIGCKSTIS